MQYKELLHKLLTGTDLAGKEMEACFSDIMLGEYPDSVIAAILALLQKKGVTPEEVAGAYFAIISKAIPVRLGNNVVDTCGTGGDQAGTFNISTVAAIIANGAGAVSYTHLRAHET